MILLILFIALPLIEIALFIMVGGEIGVVATLLVCVLTAMIGAFLVRAQGLRAIFSARNSLARGELPVKELFDGLCIGVAGAFLMTPGFFTDALGFSLLFLPVRERLRRYVAARFDLSAHSVYEDWHDYPYNRDPDVIEADFERLDRDDRP